MSSITIFVIAILTHFSLPINSPYRAIQGLQTEVQSSYKSDTCKQPCTINTQGSHSRSTAIVTLLDTISASIPPGGLTVLLFAGVIFSYYYLLVIQKSYRQLHVQRELCIWRF